MVAKITEQEYQASYMAFEYLKDIFIYLSKSNLIPVRISGKDQKRTKLQLLSLLQNTSYISKKEIYFSPHKFASGRRTEENIESIYTFALDIDYHKNPILAHIKPLDYAWYIIEQEIVPTPNYIEYGHNIRFIYVLDKYLSLKKSKECITWLKRITSYYSNKLNEELDCHCEPQTINSFFRLPGSRNPKDGSIIQIQKVSNVYLTAQEYLDELPDLPDWYDKWKDKQTLVEKSDNILKPHNLGTLGNDRIKFCQVVQNLMNNGQVPTKRELLLHIYCESLKMLIRYGYEYNLEYELKEFNNSFNIPMKENILKTILREKRNYSYKDKTLIEMFEIPDNMKGDLNIKMTKREREKEEKIAAGKTRSQVAEAQYQKFVQYKKLGKKQNEIKKIMNIGSNHTLAKWNKRYKEERD